jgi:iron(III) transport system ATP-binding protein
LAKSHAKGAVQEEGGPALRCAALTKRFGATIAVDAIDLEVRSGQFIALLGPSGCGKSTTLRLIAGFESPDAGSVEIGNQLVASATRSMPPERRRVGMVFQEGALFPHMNVAANVSYGLSRSDSQLHRVDELLAMVGLEGLGKRMPYELSGGQQQRVALARALAPGPAVVLLDEPFSNLDMGLRARLRGEVRSILRQAHATAIFVTHDQDEALSLADEVAVMWQGRIVQRAGPEQLYGSPSSRDVATFLGDANFLLGHASDSTVATELGTLMTASPASGAVDALIRPEAVRLIPDDTSDVVVCERAYFGHDSMYSVVLPSGTKLKSRVAGGSPLGLGARVRVEVHGPVATFPRSGADPAG